MASKPAFLTPRHNPRDLALPRSTEVSTSGMYPRQAFAQYSKNRRAVQNRLSKIDKSPMASPTVPLGFTPSISR
jgi:hypothetical protein